MISHGICPSLPDLLHSLWQSLGPSTSLQIALLHSFLLLSNKTGLTFDVWNCRNGVLSCDVTIRYVMLWITCLKVDAELMRGPIIVKFWFKKSLGLITVTSTSGPRESLHIVTSGWCYHLFFHALWFLGGSAVKNSHASAGDTGEADSIPELGRPPGKGNGNPLQYSYLEKPMDRGAWRYVGLQELDITEHTHTYNW